VNKRYAELDALRGIAAIMVVLFHYSFRYGSIYGYAVEPAFSFEIGQYGVQLFFIISGFVIFLTLNKTEHVSDFIVSRFSRLYPAYWAAMLFTFSVVYVFSLPGREVSFSVAVINCTMLQKWFKVASVDGVYWTLAVEMSFYVIMIFLFVTRQLRNINIVSCVWLCVILLSHYLEKLFSIHIHGALKLLFLLDYGNLFIAGIMFYKMMYKIEWSSILILMFAFLVGYLMHDELVLLTTVYFVLFTLFVTGFLKFLAIRPLVYLGSISYSLYLIHQNVGYVIIRNLETYNLATPFSIIVVPAIVSIFVASLIFRYIEKPAMLLIRNNWKKSDFYKNLFNKV